MTVSPTQPGSIMRTPSVDERRVPHLTSAIVGNGSLLATLSARGELERLFWPNVDWGQHLGELRLGISIAGKVVTWLDDPDLEHAQHYVADTTIVETACELATTRDFACPERAVLYRLVQARAQPAQLVVYIRPEIDESARYGAVFVDRVTGGLVFYRRGRALAVGISPRPNACTGRAARDGALSATFHAAATASSTGGSVEYGEVDGALVASLPPEGAAVIVAFADTTDGASALLAEALAGDPLEATTERAAADARTIATAAPVRADAEAAGLYKRSLLAFDLLSDRRTGAVIAAPEMDADFDHCGGYGFVWGRDMAYALLASIAAGRHDAARRGVDWLIATQSPEGLWLHRHCVDGSLAPSWGLHQVDETGSILLAFAGAARALPDLRNDPRLLDATQRGADFLCRFRDPVTGLPRPSVDLWEERLATHTYSAAAVAGGLRAAASLVGGRTGAMYSTTADEVAQAIDRHLWDDAAGRYRRSLEDEPCNGIDSGLPYPDELAASARKPDARSGDVVDASLLGLVWPFRVVAPDSPRMRRTVEAIEQRLRAQCGGMRRYEGDTYAGGNPWLITTLWLGLWYHAIGDAAGHRRCIDYAVKRQTVVGLLPEQVSPDGTPSWVVPLTWSHAMYVLAVTASKVPNNR